MNAALKKRAWELAAQLLDADLDAVELTSDLSAAEDDELRDYMRRHIVEVLRIVAKNADEPMYVGRGMRSKGSPVVRLT